MPPCVDYLRLSFLLVGGGVGGRCQDRQAAAVAVPMFGVAGHFSYQMPYGKNNLPFGPWPINTTLQLDMVERPADIRVGSGTVYTRQTAL